MRKLASIGVALALLSLAPSAVPGKKANLNYRLPEFAGDYEMIFVHRGVAEVGSRQTMAELATEHPTTSWAMESERPLHAIELKPFWLGKTEVTIGMYRRFVEDTKYETVAEREGYIHGEWQADGEQFKGLSWKNPGYAVTDDHPVTCLTEMDLFEYVTWLSTRTGQPYFLPVESQFEYAARAGTEGAWYTGNDAMALRDYEVFSWNSGSGPSPVGSLKPNPWGFYDLLGNVRERMSNPWNHETIMTEWNLDPDYTRYPHDDTGCGFLVKATRGMSWASDPIWIRASARNLHPIEYRNAHTGFRLARLAEGAVVTDPSIRVGGRLKLEGAAKVSLKDWTLDFVPVDWSRGPIRATASESRDWSVGIPPGEYSVALRNPTRDLMVLPDPVTFSPDRDWYEIKVEMAKVRVEIPAAPAPKVQVPGGPDFLRVYRRDARLGEQFLFSRKVDNRPQLVLPHGDYRFEVVTDGFRRGSTDWVTVPTVRETEIAWEPIEAPSRTLRASITLPPGEYQYKFFDTRGNYITDPLNPQLTTDDYKNNCFRVPGGAIAADGTRSQWPAVDDKTGEVTFEYTSTTPGITYVRGSFTGWKVDGTLRMQ